GSARSRHQIINQPDYVRTLALKPIRPSSLPGTDVEMNTALPKRAETRGAGAGEGTLDLGGALGHEVRHRVNWHRNIMLGGGPERGSLRFRQAVPDSPECLGLGLTGRNRRVLGPPQ